MRYLLILLCCVLATPTWAQEGGLELFAAGSIFSRGTRASFTNIYKSKEKLFAGSDHIDDPSNQSWSEFRQVVSLDHGFRRQLSLSVLVPFVTREMDSGGRTLRASGLGDVAVFAKKQILRNDWHLGSFKIAIAGGVELPTGRTGVRDEGIRLSPSLQPGLGSFNPFVAAATTWEHDRWRADGSILYKWNTEGAQDYKASDFLNLGASLSYRFWFERFPGPTAKATLGLGYRYEGEAEQNGLTILNSGADQLLFKPGLTWHPDPRWDIGLNAELPLYQSMRGQQLGRDFAVTLHIGFRF